MISPAASIRLIRATDPLGAHYTVPTDPAAASGLDLVDLPLPEALHARISPLGLAERVLRAATGDTTLTEGIPEDPTALTPTRTRVGAIIIRDGYMLLIRLDAGPHVYEIPGGGVEPGESLGDTIRREITEETGLTAVPGPQVARVWRTSARIPGLFLDHYFLAEVTGEMGALEDLDLVPGALPVWVPVADLPDTPVWPRRLRWRIAHWHAHGWPANPVELADRNVDLHLPCRW